MSCSSRKKESTTNVFGVDFLTNASAVNVSVSDFLTNASTFINTPLAVEARIGVMSRR